MTLIKWLRFWARLLRFRCLFHIASRRIEEVRVLQNYVGSAFMFRPLFSGVYSGLIAKPGYNREITGSICWEAPIVFAVFLNDKPAVGMGIELLGDTLSVRQLQGAHGTTIPEELRNWPKLFVEACVIFAQKSNLRCVRLYRADQAIFYSHPVFEKNDTREAREETQQRMRRRYDGTARQLKFKMEKRWGVWNNPNYKK